MMKKEFIINDLAKILSELKPDTEPAFGLMTPQHMVEHLLGSLKNFIVKHEGEREATPTKGQMGMQKFVKSGAVLKHTPSDKTKADLKPTKYDNLEEVIAQIPDAAKGFYDFFESNPDYKPYFSFAGELSQEEVQLFNYMHIRYHLWQFGLLEQYP